MQNVLTELEGAVLSEIHHRGRNTAFQVRRSLQLSPATDWSGSGGAIYPAIRRLSAAGLIAMETLPSARKTIRLSLTPQGIDILNAWIMDVGRATGIGLDPFRVRAGLWTQLPRKQQRAMLNALRGTLALQIEDLQTALPSLDSIERRRADLMLATQRLRFEWVEAELSAK